MMGGYAKSPKHSGSKQAQNMRTTSNSMMGNTSMTHESNLSIAPMYLDTTTILYSMNKINNKTRTQLNTQQ